MNYSCVGCATTENVRSSVRLISKRPNVHRVSIENVRMIVVLQSKTCRRETLHE